MGILSCIKLKGVRMALERREWINANYRKQDVKSGVHIYIDYETLKNALENTNMKIGDHLQIRRYALRGGKVVIKFRVNKHHKMYERGEKLKFRVKE